MHPQHELQHVAVTVGWCKRSRVGLEADNDQSQRSSLLASLMLKPRFMRLPPEGRTWEPLQRFFYTRQRIEKALAERPSRSCPMPSPFLGLKLCLRLHSNMSEMVFCPISDLPHNQSVTSRTRARMLGGPATDEELESKPLAIT